MPLQLLPATAEDALRAVTIEAEAYAPSTHNATLFPGPILPETLERRAVELANQLEESSTVRWLKVVDDELPDEAGDENSGDRESTGGAQSRSLLRGRMIAFAKWYVHDKEAKPSRANRVREFGPEANVEACSAFFGGLDAMRERNVVGKRCVYLSQLHTDPKHQRRGAGRMLVQWGVVEAQHLQLPAYLESSEEGHKLYYDCGFRDIDELNLDLARFGGKGTFTTWTMRKAIP